MVESNSKSEKSGKVVYLSYIVEVSALLLLLWAWAITSESDTLPSLPPDFVIPKVLSYKWPSSEKTFVSSNGLKLASYTWLPKEEPKALIFIFGGYSCHANMDANIAHQFVENGYATFQLEYEGHGHSEGVRALITDFNTTCTDALRWMSAIQKKYPNKKTFLFGSSMGGSVALRLGLMNQAAGVNIDGITLGAPALSTDLFPALRPFAKILGSLFPTWQVVPKLGGGKPMCTDNNVDVALKSDAIYNNGKMKAGMGKAFIEQFEFLGENAKNIQLPVLILHPDNDDIVPLRGSQELIRNIASKDAALQIIEGELHNFLGSQKSEQYIQIYVEWFNKHL